MPTISKINFSAFDTVKTGINEQTAKIKLN